MLKQTFKTFCKVLDPIAEDVMLSLSSRHGFNAANFQVIANENVSYILNELECVVDVIVIMQNVII